MIFSLIATASAAGKAEEPIFECPKGWEFHGDLCRRLVETARVPYCGDDGLLVGNKCMTSIPSYGSCKDGDMKGTLCSSMQVAPPISSCPADYILVQHESEKDKVDIRCEKVVSVDRPSQCPAGTTDEGKHCVSYSYVDPTWYCPPGEYMEGKFCVREEPYDCTAPTIESKKSGHLRNSHDSEKKELDIVGPYYEHHNTYEVERWCVRKGFSLAVGQCPENSLNDGKRCAVKKTHAREELAPILTYFDAPVETQCPVNYNWCLAESKKLNDNTKGKAAAGFIKKGHHVDLCCNEFIEEPIYLCPSGYEKLNTGECVRYYNPVMICPEDKKGKKKDHCSRYEYAEPNILVYAAALDKKDKKH